MAAQFTAGLEFVIFPIRRTKVTIAMSISQVALRQGDVVRILAQVISTHSYTICLYSYRTNFKSIHINEFIFTPLQITVLRLGREEGNGARLVMRKYTIQKSAKRPVTPYVFHLQNNSQMANPV